MNPNVTIVIPVYNITNELLYSCIDSCINQTLYNIEILIIDDGSNNECSRFCDTFTSDKRVKVFHTKNMGVSSARNIGIDNSLSEYIMFVDADDVLALDACEISYKAIKDNKYDFLIFKPIRNKKNNFQIFSYEMTKKKNLQYKVICHKDNENGYVIGSPWAKIFSKKFLVDNDLKFAVGVIRTQDRLFMLYCIELAKSIGFFDYQGYFYRKNSESICNKYNPNIVNILDNTKIHIQNFVDKYHSKDAEFKKAMEILSLIFLLTEIQLFYFNPNNKGNKMDEELKIRVKTYKEKNYFNVNNLKVISITTRPVLFALDKGYFVLAKKYYYFLNIARKTKNLLVQNNVEKRYVKTK